MHEMVDWLDSRTVLLAANAADRDAKYGEAPPGVIVSSGLTKQVWQKVGTGSSNDDWLDVYSDTGWVTTGFLPAPGWSIGSYMKARRICDSINIRGELVRTGGTIQGQADGNLSPDVPLVTIPSIFAPGSPDRVEGSMRASYTSGAVELGNDAIVMLADIHTNSGIGEGQYLRFTFPFFAN
ncbi:hypothetical protein LWF01_03020 [Saxibacter everestensis]|uniref:Uncharacterized protein n=1 Tax=Saxibacter everestensis TaxID=2909229 RepID=A0ABY8QX19_9MICO|nr:hypothetical protein LWF01_03020 [Brevibacteriaceae bacterium ZFBP1038]